MPTIVKKHFLNEKQALFILLGVWAIIQTSAFIHFGVVTSVDSSIYINNGLLISQGNWLSDNDVFYASYCLVIALLNLVGLSYNWVILLQIILSGIALICLYKITYSLSKKHTSAFVAGLLYIIWIKFAQWNMIVYTDSMFTHCIIISVFILLKAKTKLNYFFAFLLIIFTSFLRPTGIGFLISIVTLSLYSNLSHLKSNRIIKVSVILVVLTSCLFLVNSTMKGYVDSFLQSYANAEIIYPNIPLWIAKPESLYMPPNDHEPLVRLVLFIVNNPFYFLKLSLLKGSLFLGHAKPYYSYLHNTIIVSFLLPVYIGALKGLGIIKKHKYIAFFITFIGFQIITVAFTSENWDGRFLLPVLPWIFVLSGIGIEYFYSKFFIPVQGPD